MTPRLQSAVWVRAQIRRLAVDGIPAVVARHGDDTAGQVLVKLNMREAGCTVLSAVTGMDGDRAWLRATGEAPVPEAAADDYIARQAKTDPDLWVLEIEDRDGRHGLAEPVLEG